MSAQWHPRVEPDMRRTGDERVVAEPRVGGGVGDDQRLFGGDRILAKADLARGFGHIEPMGRFEPLAAVVDQRDERDRSEEHTSELQSLMRISYAVFCLKQKN